MTVTMTDVIEYLSSEEPEYSLAASRLGADAAPFLEEVIRTADPLMASKAVSLLSLVDARQAAAVLDLSVKGMAERVRVVAAAVTPRLDRSAAERLLATLINDEDHGVRKVAARSVGQLHLTELRPKLVAMSEGDPRGYNRTLALKVLEVLDRRPR